MFKTILIPVDTIGVSMEPTVKDNTLVFATKIGVDKIQPGDIIIVPEQEKFLIKRVVSTGDEIINIKGQDLYIDNELQEEPYIREPMGYAPMAYDDQHVLTGYDLDHFEYQYQVPKDHVYVMGDNRNDSWDSRYYGSYPKDQVYAKVFLNTHIPYTIYKAVLKANVYILTMLLLYSFLKPVIEKFKTKGSRHKEAPQLKTIYTVNLEAKASGQPIHTLTGITTDPTVTNTNVEEPQVSEVETTTPNKPEPKAPAFKKKTRGQDKAGKYILPNMEDK